MQKLAAYFILALLVTNAYTQTYKNEFGLRSDNDAYLAQKSDKYYTNGLFLFFRRALNQQNLEKKIYEISVGQEIYNPHTGDSPEPTKQDRPFAGYLYVGGAFSWFYSDESIITASARFGTVGANSLAEDAQTFLHTTFNFYDVHGWDYQIKNEFTVNLSGKYIKLLYRIPVNFLDFSFEGYADVGTTFSGAGAGVIIRALSLNQLFNSSYTNAVVGNSYKTKALVSEEVYFYAKPQLNYVAYNATIQGSMFNGDDPVTFGSKPIVFVQQLGFNYSSQRFTADMGVIIKSKEVESNAKAHKFGYISFFYRFN